MPTGPTSPIPTDSSEAVDAAADAMGGITILFNNAGTGSQAPLHEWAPEEWDRLVAVNLTGVYLGFRAAIPHIRASGGGSIVSTASIAGPDRQPVRPRTRRPRPGWPPSPPRPPSSTPLDIRVNAVSPGMILTPLTEPLLQFLPHERERYERTTPVGRIGEPEDIADVVVFLCSDMARFITGQNIVVDGGMTLHGSGVDGHLRTDLHPRPAVAGPSRPGAALTPLSEVGGLEVEQVGEALLGRRPDGWERARSGTSTGV